VGVVDSEDQQPPAAPFGEQGGGTAKGIQAVIAQPVGRQQVGDGTERDRGGRPGRHQPLDLPPGRRCPDQGLPGQPGLADPGGTGEHGAGAGVPDDGGQRRNLGLAADQRPRAIHAAILYRPIRPIE
jgi:hypothetical protein